MWVGERDTTSGPQEYKQQEDCCESTANLGLRRRLCLKGQIGKWGQRQREMETETQRGGDGGIIWLVFGEYPCPEIFPLSSRLSLLVPCP